MCVLIPFRNKRHQPLRHRLLGYKIGDAPPVALQNRELLLDLIHPGTMHGEKMEHKAGVLSQPSLDLFALVHPD